MYSDHLDIIYESHVLTSIIRISTHIIYNLVTFTHIIYKSHLLTSFISHIYSHHSQVICTHIILNLHVHYSEDTATSFIKQSYVHTYIMHKSHLYA